MSRDRVVRHRARSYWVPDVRPKAFSGMTETYVPMGTRAKRE
jgi:hypothetical protein